MPFFRHHYAVDKERLCSLVAFAIFDNLVALDFFEIKHTSIVTPGLTIVL